MDETELTQRLRDLGTHPVPDDVTDRHTHRMVAVPSAAPERRFGRFAVAAAAVVGFAFGSTGLAMAGALPDQAQDVAHDVLSTVNVDVPKSNRGQCVSAIAKNPELSKDDKKAQKAACPKGGPPEGIGGGEGEGPGRSGEAPGRSGTAPGQTKHEGDPCRGKPPWAGNKTMTDTEKADAKAARQACPDDDAEDATEDAADAAEDAAERAAEEAERRSEAGDAPPVVPGTPPASENGPPPQAGNETPGPPPQAGNQPDAVPGSPPDAVPPAEAEDDTEADDAPQG